MQHYITCWRNEAEWHILVHTLQNQRRLIWNQYTILPYSKRLTSTPCQTHFHFIFGPSLFVSNFTALCSTSVLKALLKINLTWKPCCVFAPVVHIKTNISISLILYQLVGVVFWKFWTEMQGTLCIQTGGIWGSESSSSTLWLCRLGIEPATFWLKDKSLKPECRILLVVSSVINRCLSNGRSAGDSRRGHNVSL